LTFDRPRGELKGSLSAPPRFTSWPHLDQKTNLQNLTHTTNLRFWLFVTAGVLSHPAGKTTLKLAVPERERDWWRRLWEKILSPFPNCNAVENHPAFTSQSS